MFLLLVFFLISLSFSSSILLSESRERELIDEFFNTKDDDVGYLWQLSDVHIWYNYTVGTDPDCEIDQCCTSKTEKQKYSCGAFGYLNRKDPKALCDIPEWTFLKTLEFITNLNKKYNLVDSSNTMIYTGDQVAHDLREQTREQNIDHLLKTYQSFEDFSKTTGMKVFGVVGNHDTWPESQLDFLPGSTWFFSNLTKAWKPFLSPSALETASQYGFYTDLIETGFRVVVINSQWMNTRNKFMKKYPLNSTLITKKFVENALLEARKNQEKVLLLGHVPINNERGWTVWTSDTWKKDFIDLSIEYQDILIGSLFGHEHMDRVTIHKDKDDNPVHVEFLSPALSVGVVKVNPSFRVWKYSKDNFELLNYLQFWNDLEASNKQLNFTGNWKLEYDLLDAYGIKDVKPKTMSELMDKIETDEGDLWEKFVVYHHVWWYKDSSYCDKQCKKIFMCACRFADPQKYRKCVS